MMVKFYCAYASDTLAVAAITRLAQGALEVRQLDDNELVPEEAVFFYTDYRGHFRGHHLRHIRQDGQDKIGHLTLRGFKIPGTVLATEVIALRPTQPGETPQQQMRRQRGISEALYLVHFTLTQERINGFRPTRERKRKSFGGGWRSGHLARRREERYSFACS